MDRSRAYLPPEVPEEDILLFEKGNMGERAGFGNKLSIIVVDMTRGWTEDEFPLGNSRFGQPCVRAIRQLLDVARPIGIPIFYTKVSPWPTPVEGGRWLDKGTAAEKDSLMLKETAHQFPLLIEPQPGETIITKAKPSAFFGTQLESYLNYYNIDTLIVTGMVTAGCVRATVTDAFSLNYFLIVPIECVADRSEISHKINLFDMDMRYADVMPLEEVVKHLHHYR